MLAVLLKMKSEIECVINNKQYHFPNGASAVQELKNEYSIISIDARENRIILELEQSSNTSNWQEEYKKQFGNEPSFF